MPRSLGVSDFTYSRQQFYKDIQAYIRFKTPSISLPALLSPTNKSSPLNKVARRLPKLLKDPRRTKRASRINYELRFFGCLVRVNMRQRVHALSKLLTVARQTQAEIEDVRDAIDSLITDLDPLLAKFRAMRTGFQDPMLPHDVRETYTAVDEFTSGNVEQYLTLLLEDIDRDPRLRAQLVEPRKMISERISAEQRHRRGHGYVTVLDAGVNPEAFVYRNSTLKKFVMSVLFLQIKREEEGRHVADALAAIAAGLAMFVATVATVIGQQRTGASGMSFVALLVITYMFKDRIKEWLKRFFGARMSRWIWDYSVDIHDPASDVRIGRCRETFHFVRPDQVPPEVMTKRRNDPAQAVLEETYPDVILKYEKDIRLRGDVINELAGRMNDINDIIRFKVSSLLLRSDDPIANVHSYDAASDQVRVHECPKVYHVNVVFVLRAHGKPEPAHLERVRVVVDKGGIRRLEEVA